MPSPHDLNPGTRLWFQPTKSYIGQPREVVVASVGRKWAKIVDDSRLRIDIADLAVHWGDEAVGTAYFDRTEFELKKANQSAWTQLLRDIQHKYTVPVGVDSADVAAARKLLNLETSDVGRLESASPRTRSESDDPEA